MLKYVKSSFGRDSGREVKHFQMGRCRLSYTLLALFFTFLAFGLSARVTQEITRPDTLYLGTRFFLNVTADADLADITVPDTLTRYAILKIEKLKSFRKPVGLKLTIAPLDTGSTSFHR
jgi:hypothetical protein